MIRKNPVSWLIIGLTILFATLYSESFLTGTNLESILKGFVITSMLSIGPTFVVLMGSLDVSYMGIWMFGGALVWLLFPYLGIASIFIYPIFGLALGFINGIVHVKSKIPSFILTLSMTAVLAYLTTVIRNIYGVLTLAVPEYRFLTGSLIQYVPTTFLLALPVFILSFFFMNFTKLGTYLCAIGSNE
jgi:ribose transport system permease protein